MMKYDDDKDVHVGDQVKIDEDMSGTVIADIDARCGDAAWFYLGCGVMIDTVQAGLIHYADRPVSLVRLMSEEA